MTKKVVHITTVHHPFDTRIFHKECKALAKEGYQVKLITTDHEDLNASTYDGIGIIKLKPRKKRWNRFIFGTLEAYSKAKSLNADIYHFHDPELMWVGRLLKNSKNNVIYDVHEDYKTSIEQKNYLPKKVRSKLAKVFRSIERRISRNFHICLAEKYYQDIFPKGQLILNYPPIREEYKQENVFGDGKPSLLYTGNITEDRGALIHANLTNLNLDIKIRMVGKCSTNVFERMNEASGMNKDYLDIKGLNKFISREEIDKEYFKHYVAGLALFPPTEHYKKKELTKFFEYMQAGLPIICSDFPKWKEFINKYNCGLVVDPYNHQEIRKAILFLINNPEQAKIMGENGREAINNELNWEHEEEKLKLWYKKIINNTIS
ncbi:glycosyltransferase [Bacillus sp. FJAT-44742]|uniref:glycosyltransferase n=1 Tax=Bacillus sp. FJAT-44742 TaxID=2014005 RepID=UPI000C2353AB|nr:glycosyltransferase [Bacillus sp. FJAT-44742]